MFRNSDAPAFPDGRRRRARRRLVAGMSAALAVTFGGWIAVLATGTAGAATLASTPHYSLPLALQESLYFYDAEKSGPARTLGDQPLEWRGDSEPSDLTVPLTPMSNNVGVNLSASFISANKAVLDPDGDGTVDLSGGFHDAGDHVKFGLPQSYAASEVALGMYEFADAFKATNTWTHGLDEMRWFSDYFLRSLFTDSSGKVVAFAYQVGNGDVDHAYWGPSELQSATTYPRPAWFASKETPASDQTAGAAAALALESLIVKDSDPAYATRCLNAAKALYTFSVANRGLGYSGGYYGSAYDDDELAWAAATLFLATGTHSYADDIVAVDSSGNYTGYLKKIVKSYNETWQNIWVQSWDVKWGGVFNVLDPAITNDTTIPQKVRDEVHYFNRWNIEYWSHVPHDNTSDTTFLMNTPGGFAYLNGWGSARYNVAAQLSALIYRKNFPNDAKSSQFTDWAMGQMNYVMGDNPLNRSYIVGFGSTTPGVGSQVGGSAVAAQHPHHADAHGSLTNNQDDPPNDRHILWGGLVGGPDAEDQHNDVTTDFVLNEVAVDYNAGLPGALAGLYQYYGQGQTMTAFTPPAEAAESPYYAYAEVNQATNSATQVTVTINNFATHPPHFATDMSARYFFDISELHAQGQDIGAVSTSIYYDASHTSYGQPATQLSEPVRWGDADSCIYYVTADWTGAEVSGSRAFEFGLTEAMTSDWKTYWDSTNDPSFAGLADGAYVSTPDPNVPVYLNGTLVYGQEPSLTANEGCGASSPGGGTGTPAVTAQYAVGATAATTSQITNKIQITNTGTSSIPLSALTVRYWFTEDSTDALHYACDYAPLGCANITGTFGTVSPAVTGADHYLELGFGSGAGNLGPGNSTGGIQNRINQVGYGTFTQSDDYSFNAADASLTTWSHLTVYYDGTLIYGTPPS